METETTLSSTILVVISLVVSAAWLLNRGILTSYKIDLLRESKKWLDKKPILIPTFFVFFIPAIFSYLALNPIPENLRSTLPVLTFVIGQFIGRSEKVSDFKNKQIEVFNTLKRKLSVVREKLSLSAVILKNELEADNGFMEDRLQLIQQFSDDFSKLDIFLSLTNESFFDIEDLFKVRRLSILADQLNELIESRRIYIEKCRELTNNSIEQYFQLLKNTDAELLKKIESFEEVIDDLSKIKIENQ